MSFSPLLRWSCCAAGLYLAGGAAWGAQSTAEAWLSKVTAQARQPVIATQTYKVFAGQSLEGKGQLTMLDETHFRIEVDMTISGRGLDQPVTTSLLNVGDGEFLWMEVRDPYSGRAQTRRMLFSELAAAAAAESLAFSGTRHPATRFMDLTQFVEFTAVEEGETTVTLKGDFTEEAKGKLVNQFRGGIPRYFTAVLDRATAFPLSYQISSYTRTLVEYAYSDVRHPKAEELDRSQFQYQLPEGAELSEPSADPAGKKTKQEDPQGAVLGTGRRGESQ